MKSIKEVENKLADYARPRRWTCELLVKQALEWALEKIEGDGLSMGEYKIRERINKLERKQEERDPLGFATRPARAVSINTLKWVIGEYEVEVKDVLGPVD
ncbi:hypothetical protein ES702_02141 [subsurface metagenome]